MEEEEEERDFVLALDAPQTFFSNTSHPSSYTIHPIPVTGTGTGANRNIGTPDSSNSSFDSMELDLDFDTNSHPLDPRILYAKLRVNQEEQINLLPKIILPDIFKLFPYIFMSNSLRHSLTPPPLETFSF